MIHDISQNVDSYSVGEQIPCLYRTLLFRKITCGPNPEKKKVNTVHILKTAVKKQFQYHTSIYA